MLHDAHSHLLKRDEMLSAPQDGYEPCAMASCLRLQAARFLDSVLEALAKREGGHGSCGHDHLLACLWVAHFPLRPLLGLEAAEADERDLVPVANRVHNHVQRRGQHQPRRLLGHARLESDSSTSLPRRLAVMAPPWRLRVHELPPRVRWSGGSGTQRWHPPSEQQRHAELTA